MKLPAGAVFDAIGLALPLGIYERGDLRCRGRAAGIQAAKVAAGAAETRSTVTRAVDFAVVTLVNVIAQSTGR